MKNYTNPIRFVLSVILCGVAALVILVCLCMPEIVGEVLTSQPGLVGLVIGVTIGILFGYLMHHSKVAPTIKKMKKRIVTLAKQHQSDVQNVQSLSEENAVLRKKCSELDAIVKRENVARIARLSRNDGIDVPPVSEAPAAEDSNEE